MRTVGELRSFLNDQDIPNEMPIVVSYEAGTCSSEDLLFTIDVYHVGDVGAEELHECFIIDTG